MKPWSVRLAPALSAAVRREAARRDIKPSTWAAHLIERGQMVEILDRLLEEGSSGWGPTKAQGIPEPVLERLLFAACFSEAILKKLNASLNRSTSELGTVAAQARDQAQAETAALLKGVGG